MASMCMTMICPFYCRLFLSFAGKCLCRLVGCQRLHKICQPDARSLNRDLGLGTVWRGSLWTYDGTTFAPGPHYRRAGRDFGSRRRVTSASDVRSHCGSTATGLSFSDVVPCRWSCMDVCSVRAVVRHTPLQAGAPCQWLRALSGCA